MATNKVLRLRDNSRFYIVTVSLCLSAFLFFLSRIIIVDERVRAIRLQQIYGLVAVLYWYLVLFISAFAKVVGKKTWLAPILFTRRAFGFMVAYFALLHSAIAFYAQLGGLSGLKLLPTEFRWSITFGLLALLVLLIMASLSFDKVVLKSKFRHWKALSRASYIAGVLSILHLWIIGTHVAPLLVQLTAFEALMVLFGLESWRLKNGFIKKGIGTWKALSISMGIWLLLCFSMVVMKIYVVSYSKSHSHTTEAGATIHAH